MASIRSIDDGEVARILAMEEGSYLDFKASAIMPSKLSESVSAFANTSGGELFIGVAEKKIDERKYLHWDGFIDQEAANSIFQVLESILPVSGGYKAEFLRSSYSGYILHLIVFKVKRVVLATSGLAYLRRGVQNLAARGEEAIRRLRLDKGIETFEDETLNVPTERIVNSVVIVGFMIEVVPTSEPDEWVSKQNLVIDHKPTVAGILLFDDEPQACLPKRSATKLFRYKTKEEEGGRETLAFQPVTIEGCLYNQVYEAVSKTKELIEGLKRLGENGLEPVIYPDETLHEIITNALLHRDYSIAADVQIRIFDNRIEVESPGKLSGHVTPANIRSEQSARNPKIVRLINKFPNAPNKDVGEGINTAFDAMKKLRLKEPVIEEREHSVIVHIRHESLATPHDAVMNYLVSHSEITNAIARDLTGIRSENSMKDVFLALKKRGMLRPVQGKKGSASAWEKHDGNIENDTDESGADEVVNTPVE